MRVLMIICLAAVLGVGCQSGRIPCPKPGAKTSKKVPKRMKSYALIQNSEMRNAEAKGSAKPNDSRYIGNVSVEEWDCPEPGRKKYLPRHVKKNIRKNYARMSDERRRVQSDSLSHN